MSCSHTAVAFPGQRVGPPQKESTPEDKGGAPPPFAPHLVALSPGSKEGGRSHPKS